MNRARWLAPWKDSAEKPAIYHCISRVVDRRFAFGDSERERFRMFMRMHSLSEFMKTLRQRFTRWFNRTHERSGTLWEERFKSVIVESGIAARTTAAYIDLNPVRAGMEMDPADYRWSSYGEAVGDGPKGNGKKARERFGPNRKDGARRLRGSGSPAAGVLWSMRDLSVRT